MHREQDTLTHLRSHLPPSPTTSPTSSNPPPLLLFSHSSFVQGANQAAAAAKLGYPTSFVGQVGNDAYAGMLRSSLINCNVNTSMLSTVDQPSGTALVLLQPKGENSIIIVGGANTSEEWQISDQVTQAIQTSGAVLLQREIPDVVNVIFAKLASSAKVPVVLDAGGVETPLGHDLLANLTILSPNETELARLTGLPTKTESQVQAAAEALVHQGVDKVLVKMGSKGSLLVDIYGNVARQRAVPVLSVVDTTGAGDCFTGAFAVGMLEGKSDGEAMQFAATAAALCIQRHGAIPSMPTREEVDKEMNKRDGSGSGNGSGREKGGSASKTNTTNTGTLPSAGGSGNSFW
jgi:ribokinase